MRVAFEREIDRFLASPSFADATRRTYRVDLKHFARWLDARGLTLDGIGVRDNKVLELLPVFHVGRRHSGWHSVSFQVSVGVVSYIGDSIAPPPHRRALVAPWRQALSEGSVACVAP